MPIKITLIIKSDRGKQHELRMMGTVSIMMSAPVVLSTVSGTVR